MQLRLPAAGDEIPHPIGIARSLACSARTERVGPDDHGDRLTMARDRDLFASEDALKDLREGRSGLAHRHRVRHALHGTPLYSAVQRAQHRATSASRVRIAHPDRCHRRFRLDLRPAYEHQLHMADEGTGREAPTPPTPSPALPHAGGPVIAFRGLRGACLVCQGDQQSRGGFGVVGLGTRPRRLHDCPTPAPRVRRSSSSCANVSTITSAAPVPAASRASFEG
jgi:hypothetical protein